MQGGRNTPAKGVSNKGPSVRHFCLLITSFLLLNLNLGFEGFMAAISRSNVCFGTLNIFVPLFPFPLPAAQLMRMEYSINCDKANSKCELVEHPCHVSVLIKDTKRIISRRVPFFIRWVTCIGQIWLGLWRCPCYLFTSPMS